MTQAHYISVSAIFESSSDNPLQVTLRTPGKNFPFVLSHKQPRGLVRTPETDLILTINGEDVVVFSVDDDMRVEFVAMKPEFGVYQTHAAELTPEWLTTGKKIHFSVSGNNLNIELYAPDY